MGSNRFMPSVFWYIKALALIHLFIFIFMSAKAQMTFPEQSKVTLNAAEVIFKLSSIQTLASTSEQAFWVTINDLGLLDDDNCNSLLLLDGYWRNTNTSSIYKLKLESCIALASNQMRRDQIILPIGFVCDAYKGLKLEAGRFNMQWNQNVDTRISSSDLLFGISFTPIPMIRLGTEKPFAPIPFIDTFIFSGFILHEWLVNSRTTRNANLHAKNFKAQLDLGNSHTFYRLTHNAQWTGDSSVLGALPSGFHDFIDLFTGSSSANINAPDGEQINIAGNHIGTWNMGFDVRSESMTTSVRFNHLFEDGSGQWMKNGSDGQIQIIIKENTPKNSSSNSFVDQFVYEYIYIAVASGWATSDTPDNDTKFDDFGFRFSGRDNSYNNGVYTNGWTYLNQPIHNSLFMTVQEAQRWAPSNEQIVSTNGLASGSILAHHIGSRVAIKLFVEDFRYRQKTSIVRYYVSSGVLPIFFEPYRSKDSVRSEDYAFFTEVEQYYVRLDIKKS